MEHKFFRRKTPMKLAISGKEVEVRYVVPPEYSVYSPREGQPGSVILGEERVDEVPLLIPRNAAYDTEDADRRQWAKGPSFPVAAFFELYEEVREG